MYICWESPPDSPILVRVTRRRLCCRSKSLMSFTDLFIGTHSWILHYSIAHYDKPRKDSAPHLGSWTSRTMGHQRVRYPYISSLVWYLHPLYVRVLLSNLRRPVIFIILCFNHTPRSLKAISRSPIKVLRNNIVETLEYLSTVVLVFIIKRDRSLY